MRRPSPYLLAIALATIMISTAPSALLAKQSKSDAAPESTTTFFTFTGSPRVAVSNHGNIVQFEAPAGYEHLGVGALSEGYVLCTSNSIAYDVGGSESGFGASTINCTAAGGCTITRNTSDGRLQLKQVIKKPADRAFSIAMTVKNLTGSGIAGVVLRRQSDLDVDSGGALGTAGFTNNFASSERDSVYVWNAPNASVNEEHAVTLSQRGKSPASALSLAKTTSAILDTTCNPANLTAAGPVKGDYGATIQFNLGTLGAGKTAGGTVQYRRD